MSLSDLIAADRRLAILLLLREAPGQAANDSVLYSALPEIGHLCSRDALRADLAWLSEAGLVETEALHSDRVRVARLKGRGLDVAEGRSQVPGVKHPSPR